MTVLSMRAPDGRLQDGVTQAMRDIVEERRRRRRPFAASTKVSLFRTHYTKVRARMLQRLSPSAELILVNLICFGPFAVRSVIGAIEQKDTIVFDDRAALFLLAIELVCGTLAILLLRARGWTLEKLGWRPTLRQTIGGMVLLMGSTIVIGGIYEMVRASTNIDPGAVTASSTKLTWPVLIALTLINPIYDEVFAAAYNVTATQGNGAAFAIAFSAVVRLVCHLEHGPIASVTILPMAIIFAAVYWRWRLVWPLVVAHGVMDFVGYVAETAS